MDDQRYKFSRNIKEKFHVIIIIIKEYKRLNRPKHANKLNRLLLNFLLLNKQVRRLPFFVLLLFHHLTLPSKPRLL